MNTLKNILVPVDFSPGARSALEQAVRLAAFRGASLHILHVIDSVAAASIAAAHGEDFVHFARKSEQSAAAALDKWLAQSHVPPGVKISIRVGTPIQEILEMDETEKPDLIVAGIAGTHSQTARAGSVSTKLARKARSRVLLVRADHPHPFKRIVACIDVSDIAKEVAAQAHAVALQDKAEVDFLHVWQAPWVAMPYMLPMSAVPEELPPEYLPVLKAALEGFVKKDEEGVKANEVLIQSSNHANGIAEHAQTVGADLIVVGTKGHTTLRNMFMGSTAERLLTHLPCSVLVVRGEVTA